MNQEILEVNQVLIDGMIGYMKYGAAIDENDPEYEPEFDAGYTQKHVDRCSEINDDFLASLVPNTRGFDKDKILRVKKLDE
jgi:hypothetical protein